MKSKLIIILLAFFAIKANAISVTISADDFAVGTVLGDIGGITLTAETSSNGQISSSEVAIRRTQSAFYGAEYHHHNHFNASGEIHSLYIRELFAPNAPANYTNLLSINFSPATSFTS